MIPNKDSIILFDGDCNFCSGSAQFIIRYDKKGIFKFASLQSDFGIQMLDKFSLPNNIQTIVLIENEEALLKSTAALKIAQKLTYPLKATCALIIIPTFIRDFVYDIIAKNRHHFMKNKPVCELKNTKHSSRFI